MTVPDKRITISADQFSQVLGSRLSRRTGWRLRSGAAEIRVQMSWDCGVWGPPLLLKPETGSRLPARKQECLLHYYVSSAT